MKLYNLQRYYLPFKGIFYALIASIFYSADAVAMKMIPHLDPAQLSLYRFIALFVMSMPETVKSGEETFGPKEDRVSLALRGVFGGLALFLTYTAYHYLPIGEASVILFSTPITVTVAAWIFLREPCGIFQSILVVITVIGVMLTVRLPQHLMSDTLEYSNENIYGFLAAAASVLCRTVQSVCIRKSKNVHHAILMFNFCWVAIIEGVILMAILANYKILFCGTEWIYIMLMGIFSYCGQNCLTFALKSDNAGPVTTTMSASSIVISFLLQTFLYQESTDPVTILGASLVGVCIIGAGGSKFVVSLAAKYPQNKFLRWL